MAVLTFRGSRASGVIPVRPDLGGEVEPPGHKPGLKLACACLFLPGASAVKDGYKTPVVASLLPDWVLAADRKWTGFF